MYGSKKNLFEIVDGVPARCAQLLEAGAVDAALVPVIEYQRIESGVLIPDVCVGSKRTVRSVVVVSKREDLESIRTIALDESSRTSATLVKIIYREFLGFEPRWTTASPNLDEMLADNDAALIIGDPAMTYAFEGLRVWDMAGLWRRYTDLGFVFAMWMMGTEAAEIAARIDFAGARDEGVRNKAAIIDNYRSQIPLSDAELDAYLTENITFIPDESMIAGLQLYFKLAHKHQLIPRLKPLQFMGEN